MGKSSLFNRLAGRRISIVDPTPGVTRDRVTTIVELRAPAERGGEPRVVELMDTGGYGIYSAEGERIDDAGMDLAALTPEIERQIRAGAEQADIILFVVDAQDGVVSLDETVAKLLRNAGLAGKVLAVANKVDDPSWDADGAETAALGFGNPVLVSATSGYGVRALGEAVWDRLERLGAAAEKPRAEEVRFAIVGRRNAGKSSLVNALAGEPRVIVSEIAGTTRDAVDVRIEVDGRTLLAIDTAGVRKRKSWADDIEFYSNTRTDDAIDRADVCVLLLDATEKSTQVEKRLAMQLEEKYKPTVIAVNKWDMVAGTLSPKDYTDYLTQEFPGLDFAPIVFISAKDGTGVRDLLRVIANLDEQSRHREGTGRVNHAVRTILEARGPSSRLGTRAKVFYVAQIDTQPPTIAMVVNKPSLFEGSYERYFKNQLREHLPFSEVPIKLVFSERKREAR